MARSLWKGPFVDHFLFLESTESASPKVIAHQKLQNNKKELHQKSRLNAGTFGLDQASKLRSNKAKTSSNPFRVWSRRSTILPEFIDQFFEIHNGKQFISFQVNEDMVGHKFGEFASTRKKTLHKKKVKTKA